MSSASAQFGQNAGVPTTALHDTSVVIIECLCSRWIIKGPDKLAARAIAPLIGQSTYRDRVGQSNVIAWTAPAPA